MSAISFFCGGFCAAIGFVEIVSGHNRWYQSPLAFVSALLIIAAGVVA